MPTSPGTIALRAATRIAAWQAGTANASRPSTTPASSSLTTGTAPVCP
jgi:hypothetical protein